MFSNFIASVVVSCVCSLFSSIFELLSVSLSSLVQFIDLINRLFPKLVASVGLPTLQMVHVHQSHHD